MIRLGPFVAILSTCDGGGAAGSLLRIATQFPLGLQNIIPGVRLAFGLKQGFRVMTTGALCLTTSAEARAQGVAHSRKLGRQPESQ